jgi:S-adenosylhomocysteine hydrolase
MPLQTELVDWAMRVEVVYREMPGLQLTERQMQRLWDLDGGTCAAIVRMLVTRGVLWETPTHS